MSISPATWPKRLPWNKVKEKIWGGKGYRAQGYRPRLKGALQTVGSMEILGIGIDLVEIDRIEKAMSRHGSFVSRIFSSRERLKCDDCARPARRYAACFAAKEAAGKALGLGIKGFSWREIEMLED
jgi:4'-phosphopantetheinyl transferase EntD